jgi:hypothetical protein
MGRAQETKKDSRLARTTTSSREYFLSRRDIELALMEQATDAAVQRSA